jgi:hypothetical protein
MTAPVAHKNWSGNLENIMKSAKGGSNTLLALSLCVGTLFGTTVSVAADRSKLSAARHEFNLNRSACLAGQSHQSRTTCLMEAGAALRKARRSGPDNAAVSGSVEIGGIYRKLAVTAPAGH